MFSSMCGFLDSFCFTGGYTVHRNDWIKVSWHVPIPKQGVPSFPWNYCDAIRNAFLGKLTPLAHVSCYFKSCKRSLYVIIVVCA